MLVHHAAFAIMHVGQQALADFHQRLVLLVLRVTGVALINNAHPQEFEDRKGSKVASSCAVMLVGIYFWYVLERGSQQRVAECVREVWERRKLVKGRKGFH